MTASEVLRRAGEARELLSLPDLPEGERERLREEVGRAQDLLERVGSPLARHVVSRHYLDGLTWDAAAREVGRSKAWVYRMRATAMEEMGEVDDG